MTPKGSKGAAAGRLEGSDLKNLMMGGCQKPESGLRVQGLGL